MAKVGEPLIDIETDESEQSQDKGRKNQKFKKQNCKIGYPKRRAIP